MYSKHFTALNHSHFIFFHWKMKIVFFSCFLIHFYTNTLTSLQMFSSFFFIRILKWVLIAYIKIKGNRWLGSVFYEINFHHDYSECNNYSQQFYYMNGHKDFTVVGKLRNKKSFSVKDFSQQAHLFFKVHLGLSWTLSFDRITVQFIWKIKFCLSIIAVKKSCINYYSVPIFLP